MVVDFALVRLARVACALVSVSFALVALVELGLRWVRFGSLSLPWSRLRWHVCALVSVQFKHLSS